MKLGTKIVMGFVLTNVIFIALVVVVFVFMRPVQIGSNNLSENVLPLLTQARTIQYNVAMEGYEIRSYLMSHDDEAWNSMLAHSANVNQGFKEVEENLNSPNGYLIRTPQVLEAFEALKRDYARYHEMALQVKPREELLITSRNNVMAGHADFSRVLLEYLGAEVAAQQQEVRDGADGSTIWRRIERVSTTRSVKDEIDEVALNIQRAVATANYSYFEESRKHIDAGRSLLQILDNDTRADATTAKEMLQSLFGLLNTTENLLNTLIQEYANSAVANRERGTLNANVVTQAAQLLAAGNQMASSVAEDAAAASNRVITALIIGSAVAILVSIVMAIFITRGITIPINRIINLLSEGAHEVDNASGQLSQSSNTLAEGATENAASLEETSAALEELSSMTSRNADNAAEANALMAEANRAVRDADSSMSNVIRAMDEISVSGNEIGKIIKTIDEIAFQTNLLALNAAVEAARAGEAGAGFAVVADEVRNLAIRSADAAKNTADLIASTINNISSGSDMVNSTAESFKTVESHASKVAELLSEVAAASKEQSQGIEQITTAMTQMDKVTQSNAASAEESASAAGQLSLQATNLLSAVDEMNAMVHGAGGGSGRTYRAPAAASPAPRPAVAKNTVQQVEANKALPMDDDFGDF